MRKYPCPITMHALKSPSRILILSLVLFSLFACSNKAPAISVNSITTASDTARVISTTQDIPTPYPLSYPSPLTLPTPFATPYHEPEGTSYPSTSLRSIPTSQLFDAPGGWFTLQLPATWTFDPQSSSYTGTDGYFKMAYLPEVGYMRWATQVCDRLAYTSMKGWRTSIYGIKGTGACVLFEKSNNDPGTRRVVIKIPKAPPDQRFFYLEANSEKIESITSTFKFIDLITPSENSNYVGGPLRPEDVTFWAKTGEFPAGMGMIESTQLISVSKKSVGDALLSTSHRRIVPFENTNWRVEPTPSAAPPIPTPIIEDFGYHLTQTGHDSEGRTTYKLYKGEEVLVQNVIAFEPMTLSPSGSDFWMRLWDNDHNIWILRKSGPIPLDRNSSWLLQNPVFSGKDLFYVTGTSPSQVQVVRNGTPIFSISIALGADNPVRFYLWKNSWLLEEHGTLIQDGVILNEKLGYEEIFDWRPINEKPFYFFRKGPRVGISYDGKILPIWYDDVYYYGCCGYAALNPYRTKYMVDFFALRDNLWRRVEIGFK